MSDAPLDVTRTVFLHLAERYFDRVVVERLPDSGLRVTLRLGAAETSFETNLFDIHSAHFAGVDSVAEQIDAASRALRASQKPA